MAERHENVTALTTGFRLSDYQIEGVLGQGAFGITYLASDLKLQVKVAIKEYFPREFSIREGSKTVRPSGSRDDVEFFQWGLERFLSEARTLARLNHPNIVTVRRLLEANQTAYLVMDYCEGRALDEVIQTGDTLNRATFDALLLPLLDALEHVHKRGLIHRDIKPANIYVREDGSPVLLDFGAARHDISMHSKSVTSLATAGYAPLEQYDTKGLQGPWSDIYGLSATFYRALTGEKPPDAAGRVLEDSLRPLEIRLKGRFPEEALRALDRGLAVMPNKRPQSVEEWKKLFGFLPDRAPLEKESSLREDSSAVAPSSEPFTAERTLPTEAVSSSGSGAMIALLLVIVSLISIAIFTGYQTPEPARKVSTAAIKAVEPPQTNKSASSNETPASPKSQRGTKSNDDAPPKETSEKSNGKSESYKDCDLNLPSSEWSACKGLLVQPSGEKYVGFFRNGKYHGYGELEMSGEWMGHRYAGNFEDGVFHGKGSYFFPSGASYIGDYKDGVTHGKGIYLYENGDRFVGQYRNGERHGPSVFTAKGGSKLSGNYINGKLSGKVKHELANGDVYEGTSKDGLPHGRGRYTFKSGSSYEGDFKDGKKEGKGTYRFSDGKTYVGEFKNDNFDGLGTYTLKNGGYHKGEWKDGKRHGQGFEYFADGKAPLEGVWSDGEFIRAERVPDYIAGRNSPPSSSNSNTSATNLAFVLPSIQPKDQEQAGLLQACQKLASESAINEGLPKKLDDVTTAYAIRCKVTEKGLVLTYLYTISGEPMTGAGLEFATLKIRQNIKKEWCGGSELEKLLELFSVEFHYSRRQFATPEITAFLQKSDCD